MDTVRADHLSLYGYERETAPFLTGLAKTATLYRRATAVSDFTLPTHASMFIGVYPDWHGAVEPVRQKVRPEIATLAEILRSSGYWTAEAVANFAFLSPAFGMTRGFAASYILRPVQLFGFDNGFCILEVARRLLNRWPETAGLNRLHARASDITRVGATMLDRARASVVRLK